MAAVADLGGLGNEEGPQTAYNAVSPSVLPVFLPWLLVLLLFLPKPNRCAQAWWVLLPLVVAVGTCGLAQAIGGFSSNSPTTAFLEVLTTLAFGFTATWLLAPYLRRSHRVLTLLLTVGAMAAVNTVIFLLRQGLSPEWDREAAPVAIATLVCTAVLSLALCLAGLACRRRYGKTRVFFWLLGVVAVLWVLFITPFYVTALVKGQGAPTPFQFCMVLLVVVGLTFGSLLPFLVLAFSNHFYGERLKGLLNAEPAAPPVVAASPTTGATV